MNSKTIYYGKQFINNEDIKLVKKSLKQKLITTGNSVHKFESNICKYKRMYKSCINLIILLKHYGTIGLVLLE